jgi:hypothetical protein
MSIDRRQAGRRPRRTAEARRDRGVPGSPGPSRPGLDRSSGRPTSGPCTSSSTATCSCSTTRSATSIQMPVGWGSMPATPGSCPAPRSRMQPASDRWSCGPTRAVPGGLHPGHQPRAPPTPGRQGRERDRRPPDAVDRPRRIVTDSFLERIASAITARPTRRSGSSSFASDAADVFENRGHVRPVRGEHRPIAVDPMGLTFSYEGPRQP